MTLKDLHAAYREWCNCGNKGSFLDWAKRVGISFEDLDREKENKTDE